MRLSSVRFSHIRQSCLYFYILNTLDKTQRSKPYRKYSRLRASPIMVIHIISHAYSVCLQLLRDSGHLSLPRNPIQPYHCMYSSTLVYQYNNESLFSMFQPITYCFGKQPFTANCPCESRSPLFRKTPKQITQPTHNSWHYQSNQIDRRYNVFTFLYLIFYNTLTSTHTTYL